MSKRSPGSGAGPTLDLHGYRVEEVWPALDRFIRKSQDQGLESVRVMTGKGTGKVRDEALRALKLGGFPHKPEKLSNGTTNDGVWVVWI